ncbi:hypothetical protein JCM24511_07339 [Saitozyma sp. JCM 24511]|nr:hypothetical protein JCM24511_07339 [Saitozyma sp. JCM 24511]
MSVTRSPYQNYFPTTAPFRMPSSSSIPTACCANPIDIVGTVGPYPDFGLTLNTMLAASEAVPPTHASAAVSERPPLYLEAQGETPQRAHHQLWVEDDAALLAVPATHTMIPHRETAVLGLGIEPNPTIHEDVDVEYDPDLFNIPSAPLSACNSSSSAPLASE